MVAKILIHHIENSAGIPTLSNCSIIWKNVLVPPCYQIAPSYRKLCSYPHDIKLLHHIENCARTPMSYTTWGDIMSTVEGVQYRGGKHLLLFEYPTVLNTPTVLMISPTCIMLSPHGTQISKDGIPPRY